MAPPRTDHLDEAYPAALRDAEAQAIANRRSRAGVPATAPLVGVALSGGGIRSATFCLGLFQALAKLQAIRRIDVLSTVSGGGYFGSFLGASFSRADATPPSVEKELADNYSWSVEWLRNNGRFLSPNGSGDNWMAAAVAVRNWIALHVVLLTFGFCKLGLAALIRSDLWSLDATHSRWQDLENFFWAHQAFGIWWSPWMTLPLIPLVLFLIPSGTLYWLTQFGPLMSVLRRIVSWFRPQLREWTNHEFSSRLELLLTRAFMVGLMLFVGLTIFALIDSLGQTLYWLWAENEFEFPRLWVALVGIGAGGYTFGARIFVFIHNLLGSKKLRITFDMVALVLSLVWLLLILVALAVIANGFAWGWQPVWDGEFFYEMRHGWELNLAVVSAIVLSWWFSRCFSFVNLSSLQQVYAARIRRAYIGASNPHRQKQENYSMTDLLPGDDFCMDDYTPHVQGGPLHLINITINETVSGKTQIERRDRKGLAMAVGPCGLSVGNDSHALWVDEPEQARRHRLSQALWDNRTRPILPIAHVLSPNDPLLTGKKSKQKSASHRVEALSVGRWCAISGAAFTTGLGSSTHLGLSLLLGLANVRLGYWWDSGIDPRQQNRTTPPTFLELGARVIAHLLPVQSCLMSEFFAQFHGPARRHWYLSDGGHFENTACYELIRRRVPFIICSDAGQDAAYEFTDLANLIRKARTDFGAEIEVLRSKEHALKDDPGVKFPLPVLEDVVHPALLDVIGSPEDFTALTEPGEDEKPVPCFAKKHAILARVHYMDTDTFSWLLLLKPSLMGDESVDVVQYQRTHPLFPQETTSDQYFDESQWESYRKLGEHMGVELFTPPAEANAKWSPSRFAPPSV